MIRITAAAAVAILRGAIRERERGAKREDRASSFHEKMLPFVDHFQRKNATKGTV